jgi:hypothetical protein
MGEQADQLVEQDMDDLGPPSDEVEAGEVVRLDPQMALTPMHMLERAVTSGADVEVLERLVGLQERYEAKEAARRFSVALSDARASLPKLVKNKEVNFGQGAKKTQYKYEDLSSVVEQLAPVLVHHGLSFRWRTDTETVGTVKVTCILSHRDGHSEETTLGGPVDNSGNKNAIQAVGSAVTYLQRYTLKAALGVAASDDDDGRQGAPVDQPPQPDPPGQQGPPPGYGEQWPAESVRPISKKQVDLVLKLAKSHVWTEAEQAGFVDTKVREWTSERAKKGIDWMQSEIKDRKQVERDEKEAAND